MNQTDHKQSKKTYTAPELILRGVLLSPEDDFTKTSFTGTTTKPSTGTTTV